jgi:hypothetical protein
MDLSRRELLVGGGALLASCRSAANATNGACGKLDAVLAAHAGALPEAAGRGASHYPMAAEALTTLGHEHTIPGAWQRGAAAYAGHVPRRLPIPTNATTAEVTAALGDHDRFGDWLDHFDALLAIEPWRDVVAAWAPQLAPGLSGAVFHGAIRTAHAVRALRARSTAVRHHELAIGLAYWAARYTELPVATTLPAPSFRDELESSPPPHLAADADVAFGAVMPHLLATAAPLADPFAGTRTDPYDAIVTIGRDAAVAFLEMLVQERQRIWLLHTVTAPAAIALLLPEVDATGAHRLVAHTRQAVVAMFHTFGAPFTRRASVRSSPPPWPELIARAANSNSVHTIKLVEALHRLDAPGDMLCRSVAVQWLEWR